MNMDWKVIGFVVLAGFSAAVCARAQTRTSDTISFGVFPGLETYGFVEKDAIRNRSGAYSFTSRLIPSSNQEGVLLRELLIGGNYVRNRRNGVWSYKYNAYSVDDLSMRRSWNVTLQHKLNGVEEEYRIPYEEGRFKGSARYAQREIVNGRYGNQALLGEIDYVNDTIVGNFKIAVDGFVIQGTTDKRGLLDGALLLRYRREGDWIVEVRKYKVGFLLELEKRNETTGDELVRIVYDDAKGMLSQIESGVKNLNFEVSDKVFDLVFNLGYQQSDRRITEQLEGNGVMKKHIHLFDSIQNHNSVDHRKHCLTGFTSRFRYLYDPKEDSLVAFISAESSLLNDRLKDALSKPNVLLRKNNSDASFQQYQILQHIKTKSDTLELLLEKIESGYFEFRARDEYYTNGIPGLNKRDTLFYSFNEKSISEPFRFDQRITNADSLIQQIGTYLDALKHMANATILKLSESLSIYENQETIDQFDREIGELELMMDEMYGQPPALPETDLSKAPYSFKVFYSLNERILGGLKRKYLNNSLPQDEMIQLGGTLVCYYTFLTTYRPQLNEVDQMQKYWNDSLFTVYRDNPFDFRKLETKVLEGVQSAAGILLKHYAIQLLNARSCDQLRYELDKISGLNRRVEYLARNRESENVQQLNKALRRERVVNRIERLLEL